MAGVDPQAGIGGNNKGTDIQGGARLAGNPVFLHLYQRLDGVQRHVLRQGGDAQTLTGVVEPAHIVHGTEELHAAVGPAVGLHPLKDLLGVVEHHGGGVQPEGPIGHDPSVVPALSGIIVHQEHMVGEGVPENQRLGVGLGFQVLGILNGELVHMDDLLPFLGLAFRPRGKIPGGGRQFSNLAV